MLEGGSLGLPVWAFPERRERAREQEISPPAGCRALSSATPAHRLGSRGRRRCRPWAAGRCLSLRSALGWGGVHRCVRVDRRAD